MIGPLLTVDELWALLVLALLGLAVAFGVLMAVEAWQAPRVELEGPPPVHACPPDGSGVMPCCGRTPFEVPRGDRLTAYGPLVTCGGAR